MTEAKYLDIYELAEVLNISVSSIRRRLNSSPWDLPPPAHLGQKFPIRWRQQEVETWIFERGLQTRGMKLSAVSTEIVSSIETHLAKKTSTHEALQSVCEAERANP